MIPRQDLVILLLFFLSSLLAVWILFRFLKAEAETRPLRLSGSLPGFILVFGILYLSYWRLFEKGYAPAVILIVFHFLSLFGSWLLFRKLRSTARVVVDRFSLAELLGEHATGKFRIGGGIAGYVILYLLLYAGYYYTVDYQVRIQYAWQGEAFGAAKVIENFFDGVSSGRNCKKAHDLLTKRLIKERQDQQQDWSTADEFCKYYATNRGHTNISYKRLRSPEGVIKFLVTVDFSDEYIKNKFREELFGKRLGELKAIGEQGILEIFSKTFYLQVEKIVPPQKEGMKKDLLGELERLELKHFLAPSSIHNVLRRLRLELQPTDAIL